MNSDESKNIPIVTFEKISESNPLSNLVVKAKDLISKMGVKDEKEFKSVLPTMFKIVIMFCVNFLNIYQQMNRLFSVEFDESQFS